jgi:hypothetical protein
MWRETSIRLETRDQYYRKCSRFSPLRTEAASRNIMMAWLKAREKVTSTQFFIRGSFLLYHVDG